MDCRSTRIGLAACKLQRKQSIFAIIACVKGSKPQDIRSHDQSPRGLPQFLGYATATSGDPSPMSAPLLHIESSPSLPREADVVVIGGGVVGVFASYYLAHRGLKVALLEKGRVAVQCNVPCRPGATYPDSRMTRPEASVWRH